MRKLILAVLAGLMTIVPASAAVADSSEDLCQVLRPWCG